MKTTRRLLTVLLALALLLSLAVTVSAQEDHAPFLSWQELRNDEDGWYEPVEEPRTDDDGVTALDWTWRIYYLNTWDAEAEEYVSEPVIVQEDHKNLTVSLAKDDPEEGQIREGEPNADYFLKFSTGNSMEHQDTEVYYMYNGEKVSLAYHIYAREAGFYTTDTPSAETAILNWDYRTNALLEENSFYYIFRSAGYWKGIEDTFYCNVGIWDDNGELYHVPYTEATHLITVEDKGNFVYKITVDPEFVTKVTGDWYNFEIQAGMEAEGEDESATFDRGIWVNPGNAHEMADARIWVDDTEYCFYADSDTIGTWQPQYEENDDPLLNDWGDHIYYWVKTELPAGVTYNVKTNTLTLKNASLTRLEVGYYWANRNEQGEVNLRDDGTREEGWNLPNENLTVKLQGTNEIVCDYEAPLVLKDQLHTTINGSGSLRVVAINSTDNKRTENHDGNEFEVYHGFDALRVSEGSSLTIAGSAKVTSEIRGGAYETIWNENGPTDRYQNAYLSAVRVDENDLTLKDKAVLTTVLPEDARDNCRPVAEGEEFSGGYRGVENVRNLTVQDEAKLTTSTLHVGNGWQWNEEEQRDEITWTGTYNQTGGTVTITGLGSYGYNQDDQGQLIDHYHYSGLGADNGQINISGGTLDVTAAPTDEEKESSAWAVGIHPGDGELNISGGTVNVNMRFGRAISADRGDVTVSGGTVNLYPYDGEGITVGDWEDNPNDDNSPDGTLTISGGKVNIECKDSGQPFSAILQERFSGELNISGGEVNIENGTLDILSTMNISGGKITLEATTDQNHYGAFGPASLDAVVNMSGGEVILNTTNYRYALIVSGTFNQTNGTVTIHADVTDEWRETYAVTDENGNVTYIPEIYGVLAAGRMELSGGTMDVYSADVGLVNDVLWDAALGEDGDVVVTVDENISLVVRDTARLNVSGEQFGIFSYGAMYLEGGNVLATGSVGVFLRSVDRTFDYYLEDGSTIPYIVDDTASLSITGGDHSFVAPTDSKECCGLLISDCPVYFENASLAVIGARGLFEVKSDNDGSDGSALTGSYYAISMKNGEEMDRFLAMDNYEYEGQSYTDALYVFTEDNQAPTGAAEDINYATELLLLPDNKCGDKATWQIEDGVLTISGEGAMYNFTPDFANRRTSAPWFPVKHAITKVVVEEGITAVGDWSFAWLDEVTHISYPASMTDIGTASLVQTRKLAGFTVASGSKSYASPDGVSIVDIKHGVLNVVAQAAPGKTYTVPKNVKAIDSNAMTQCGFETVVIPEGVTELMNAVFEGCVNLKSVTVPKSVTKLGNAVFVGCDNVTVTVCCGTAADEYVVENGIPSIVIHDLADATCTEPKVCKICKAAEGEKLGHKWGEWTTGDDGVKSRTCSVCKETETEDPTEPSKPAVSDCGKDASCPLSAYVDLIPGDWYHDGIHYCIDNGLMNGMSANTFEAGGFTTRAQLVTILYRAAGQPDITGLSEPFTDVAESDWYYKSIVWAYNNQVVNGMTADTFAPNGNVTREQVATILYRYSESPAVSGSLEAFPDVANVSSYAQVPMIWATGEGLINGVMQPDGTSLLDPVGNATRAQIATILMRYLTK